MLCAPKTWQPHLDKEKPNDLRDYHGYFATSQQQ